MAETEYLDPDVHNDWPGTVIILLSPGGICTPGEFEEEDEELVRFILVMFMG